MQFFDHLGSLVEQRWRETNYDEERFPDLAAQALVEQKAQERVDPWDVIRWCHTSPQLPTQVDSDGKFGEPPLTVFAGPRFHIDVYFWVDGTTSIHQHGFSGAFQVLLGSSVHSQYRFENEQRISAYFSIGQVILQGVEQLRLGDIRKILPGRRYIHSLFHLDRPSATITIRTYDTPGSHPQYNYLKPHFAVDPFFKEPSLTRKLQTVHLLLTVKHPDADSRIGELLAAADFHTAFSILETARNYLCTNPLEAVFRVSTGRERYTSLLEKARLRHGHLVDLIPPVVEECQRQLQLIQCRAHVPGNNHRFLLALLLNVPQRTLILDLVRQRFPEREPSATVAEWVEELAHTKAVGSREPNVLGIDHFDEKSQLILQCRLRGLSLDQTKKVVREESPDEPGDSLDSKVEKVLQSFQKSIPLQSLLGE